MGSFKIVIKDTVFFQVLIDEEKNPYSVITDAHEGLRVWAYGIVGGRFQPVCTQPGTLIKDDQSAWVIGGDDIVIDTEIYQEGPVMLFMGNQAGRYSTSDLEKIEIIPTIEDVLAMELGSTSLAIDIENLLEKGKINLKDYASIVISELFSSEIPQNADPTAVKKLFVNMEKTDFYTKALPDDPDLLDTSYCIWAFEKIGDVYRNVTAAPGLLAVDNGKLRGGGLKLCVFSSSTQTKELVFRMGNTIKAFDKLVVCACPAVNPQVDIDYPEHVLNIEGAWGTEIPFNTEAVMIDLSLNDAQPADHAKLRIQTLYDFNL